MGGRPLVGREGGRGAGGDQAIKPSHGVPAECYNMHQISLVYFKQQIIGQTWSGPACDWSSGEQCEEKRKRWFHNLPIMSPSLPVNSYYHTNNSCSTHAKILNIQNFVRKYFLQIFKKTNILDTLRPLKIITMKGENKKRNFQHWWIV